MPKRYRKLRGDTAYYPFAARTGLRARQRRHVRVLRGAGLAALALAAVLLVRQTVFRGGQPDAPAAVRPPPAGTGRARPPPAAHWRYEQAVDKNVPTDCVCSGAQ